MSEKELLKTKDSNNKSARGIFSQYANKKLIEKEKEVFKDVMIKKHKNRPLQY